MATSISPSSSIPTANPRLSTHSCIRCASRKVKCDRQNPCGACVRHKVDCLFNPTPPTQRRRRRIKDQIVNERLRQYESILQEHGIDPHQLVGPSTEEIRRAEVVVPEIVHVQTPSSITSEPTRDISKTQVVHGQGRSKIVDNSLWTRVVEEFHDPEDALEDFSDAASEVEASDDDFSFVLGSQKAITRSRHPSPEIIHQLWQIFIENIDPLTKVIHVPTVRPAMQKAAENLEMVPRSFETLMFAIYGAAIMSLKEEDCQQKFGEPRKILLSRYTSATKAALARARFMGTSSLVVLQALVIHLFAVRDIYEPRAVWVLTGVAIRIAQTMGLERDGDFLGLPPFEAEMRRRLWWLLKGHDFRSAELCGLAKFRGFDMSVESPRGPTNVNDDKLYPGMSSLPPESDRVTDVVFISMRHHLATFAGNRIAKYRAQGKDASQWGLHATGSDKVEIQKAYKEMEEVLETKYLRYCDPCLPLHLVTMLTVRSALNYVRFMSQHPRSWPSIDQVPLSEQQEVWDISLKLLEQHQMWQSNPQLKQFAWHAAYFMHWHVLIHVFDTLRANPLTADAEKAWQVIRQIYENNPDMVYETKKLIRVAVGNLCLKAYSAREAALQSENKSIPSTPDFILQLRQQREAAKARKQARDARRSQFQKTTSQTQTDNPSTGAKANGVSTPSNTQHSAQLQQNSALPAQDVGEPVENDDPFWFLNGFEDNQIGNLKDVMDMDLDLDFTLPSDRHGQSDANQSINWEQWDAWMVDSNMMRPT